MTQFSPTRLTLQAEGAVFAAVCLFYYASIDASWTLFALLILAPDLFMLGYLAGPRIGALCYNLGHTTIAPFAVLGLSGALGSDLLLHTALIWGVHIGADRALGYGLKHASGFKVTHLSRV